MSEESLILPRSPPGPGRRACHAHHRVSSYGTLVRGSRLLVPVPGAKGASDDALELPPQFDGEPDDDIAGDTELDALPADLL